MYPSHSERMFICISSKRKHTDLLLLFMIRNQNSTMKGQMFINVMIFSWNIKSRSYCGFYDRLPGDIYKITTYADSH